MAKSKTKKSTTTKQPLIQTTGLTKLFGDFAACRNIDLSIAAGENHALLGENGAGKSTLVKMLYGILQPSAGEIVWKGDRLVVPDPATARQTGIGMVFQHFSLFEALSVSENIALSMPENMSVEATEEAAAGYAEKYGLPLNPKALVGDLSVGERQRVEIVRCLLQEPELLVLDEPTSVLTPQEADMLFETIAQLKAEGRSVLYISHRLDEVRSHCDNATVLRHGEVVGACNPKRETVASLARMMVGEGVDKVSRPKAAKTGEVVLAVNDLSTPARSPFEVPLESINLTVKAGEVVSIAGIAGNGQSELFEVLCGERLAENPGTVEIRGAKVGRAGINERRAMGSAFVPEERNGHGAVGVLTLSQNVFLSRHTSDAVAFKRGGPLGLIWWEMIRDAAKRISETMDVRKASEDPPAGSLSGGNLQKFIVGRELDRQPTLMVVNQPSWGVDAGAATRIRQELVNLSRSGSAVLVLSQDLDEILEISDMVAVMFDGTMSDTLTAKQATREKIGLLMSGVDVSAGEGKNVA